MKQAILVPIDNRPVTYVYPQLIARIAGVQTIVPPRNIMGSLSNHTQVEALTEWLTTTLKTQPAQALLLCADSLIYGGLIPSRRIETDVAELLTRTKQLSQLKKLNTKLAQVYVQSSIMRISDNYDNTEEKPYWSRYGREIFAWSEALHRMQAAGTKSSDEPKQSHAAMVESLEAKIETPVREDYLATRRRNYSVNKKLLEYAQSGAIDLLIFSQDDSGEFGLNILEKERLLSEAKQRNVKNVLAYAGADEVLATMLGRALLASAGEKPAVQVSFSPTTGDTIRSRYEGQSIGESVNNQLAGIGLKDRVGTALPPALHLVIHTAGDRQGDHICLPGNDDSTNLNTEQAVAETMRIIDESPCPVVLCDVAYANGADPLLVEALLSKPTVLTRVWAYAGWNTTGNTLGSALATGIACWYADRMNIDTGATARGDALFVRLSDDWAYQANVRKQLTGNVSSEQLTEMMSPYLKRIEQALDYHPEALNLSQPWQRTFEIEVGT
jgi:Protein of unknown function (DUF4127)